jgi:hypothetical protein
MGTGESVDDVERVYKAQPSADEINDVLGKRVAAAVGTLNEDGSIHLAYVLFLHDDGRLYFETSSITRKARNAERRGWTSMLIQGQASTGRMLMVTAEGKAQVHRGPKAHEINRRLRAKYLKPEALDAVDRVWAALDDVAIEITPGRWRSWTGSALHEATQKELDLPYDDAWLPSD